MIEECGNCDVEGLIPEGKTAVDCVVCQGRGFMLPRPAGASWCGVQDAVGNVAQICDDGLARGGSFRSTHLDGPRVRGPVTEPADDVGFRCVLSV